MSKSKEPIRLRQRRTKSGLISLYLDIYLNGKRSYEYLKMYLVPERTRADKEKNKQTLLLADAIRAKRVGGENGLSACRNSLFVFVQFIRRHERHVFLYFEDSLNVGERFSLQIK